MNLSLRSIYAPERIGLTMIISLIVHILIVLGLGFVHFSQKTDQDILEKFEVTLVDAQETLAPKEADYLGQVNQEGAGNTAERVRPSAPPPAPEAADAPGNSLNEQRPESRSTSPNETPVLSVDRPAEKQVPRVAEAEEEAPPAQRNLAELMKNSRRIAQLTGEFSNERKIYSRNPRGIWISGRVKEYRYAVYEEQFRHKVERVGALNYPRDPRDGYLTGSLMLEVGIDAEGRIYSINVRSSSGDKRLDDAAVGIVKRAAPFAPLSKEILKEGDVLYITRTWIFDGPGNVRADR